MDERKRKAPDVEGLRCSHCGKVFERRIKGYKRSKLHSTEKEFSAAEVLEGTFKVPITPEAQQKVKRFICPQCSASIKAIHQAGKKQLEAARTLEQTMSEQSYIGIKVITKEPTTPTPPPSSSPRGPRLKKTAKRLYSPKPRSATKQPKSPIRGYGVMARAAADIRSGRYYQGFKKLQKHSAAGKRDIGRLVQNEVRAEVNRVGKDDSVLRTKPLQPLNYREFSLKAVDKETKAKCPTLFAALKGATVKQHGEDDPVTKQEKESSRRTRGAVVSMLANNHNKTYLTRFQKVNSLQMWLAGCKRRAFDDFARLGWCQAITATRYTIDTLCKTYDKSVQSWKSVVSKMVGGQSTAELSSEEEEEDVSRPASGRAMEGDADVGSSSETVDGSSSDVMTSETSESETDIGGSEENEWEDVEDWQEVVSDTEVGVEKRSQQGQDESTEDKRGFTLCFDNVNMKTTARHQTRDRHNKMLNMVQVYAARDRIPSMHLSDDRPSSTAMRDIPLDKYLPSPEDLNALKEEMALETATILVDNVEALMKYRQKFKPTPHEYATESKMKSELVPLGIVDKDEARTSDMIDILDHFHQWVPKDSKGNPVPIVLYGDGLTCERVKDAVGSRVNAKGRWWRLQGLEICIQEWHKRQLRMQDTLDELYKNGNARDIGTLTHIKFEYGHRNASGNASSTFNYNKELLDFATDAYVLAAALDEMGINDLSQTPEDLPDDEQLAITYINDIASRIVEMVWAARDVTPVLNAQEDMEHEYCWCGDDLGSIAMVQCENSECPNGEWFHLDCLMLEEEDLPDGDWFCTPQCEQQAKELREAAKRSADAESDGKREYSKAIVWRGLNDLVRRRAVKRNDGLAMARHWRFDMLEFHCRKHPKYLLLGNHFLTALNGGVSERLRHQMTWDRTVNINGGEEDNIAMDLYNEFLNGYLKDMVKTSGGQLTEDTLKRHGRLVGLVNDLYQHYGKAVSGKRRVQRKEGSQRREGDLKALVGQLLTMKPFKITKGRTHKGFKGYKLDSSIPKPEKLKAALIRGRKRWADARKVQEQREQHEAAE